MEDIKPDIKKLLKEKAQARNKVSITLREDQQKELIRLMEVHSLTLSGMIEVCIEVGLHDPYINSKKGGEED